MGFAKDHLLMATFDPRVEQYSATQTKQFYKLLTERLREAPGVQNARLTQTSRIAPTQALRYE